MSAGKPAPMPGSVAFLGTPAIAVPTLVALCEAGIDVDVVVTAPDARRSRRGAPSATPVRAEADRRGIDVVFDHADLVGRGVSTGVVVAYGRLLPVSLLDEIPMLNLHFSLLPRWRGAAPVEHAILAGDTETGVCVMGIESGLDSGPIHAVARTPVGSKTRDELWDELAHMGAALMVDTLLAGIGPGTPQEGEVTLAPKLGPSDRHIDWGDPAEEIDRVVRIGGAWTTIDGQRLGIESARPSPVDVGDAAPGSMADDGPRVACGRGHLELDRVVPEGRPRMDAVSWWNGLRHDSTRRLGT